MATYVFYHPWETATSFFVLQEIGTYVFYPKETVTSFFVLQEMVTYVFFPQEISAFYH
jgi:hypothetical protein